MFQTIPINITGPTFQSRSRQLSSQETLNFYQEINKGGEEEYVLMPWFGSRFIASAPGTNDRGMAMMSGTLYRVVDEVLYRLSGGAHFLVGNVPGNNKCFFANDGVNLFICSDNTVYWYNGSIVQTVTDTNIDDAFSVDFINNQFIYTKSSGTTVSTVGDGSTASGLDIVGAESQPDNLVRDYVFNEEIIRFGSRTLERWYNSGVGRPPIERLQGQTQQIGLNAPWSIARTDNYYYFLSSDGLVYQGQTGFAQSITPAGIANSLLELRTSFFASQGMTVKLQGQSFYILTVGDKTFALNESLGVNGWFSLSEGDDSPYQFTSIIQDGISIYCADGADVYDMEASLSDNGTNQVKRSRITQAINGNIINQRGKRMQMSRFELIAEIGDGVITGDDTDPVIKIESSVDAGETWTDEGDLKIGWLGTKMIRGEWHSMKTFYDMILRISVTESVVVYPRSAVIDLRLAGT
jgi:hypothetical protein